MTPRENLLYLLAKAGWTVTNESNEDAKAVVVATDKN